MAITKVVNETSLIIEVQKGTDVAGDPIYTNRTFSNLRNDVELQKAYDVAEAIKAILEASTRNTLLSVSSNLVNA